MRGRQRIQDDKITCIPTFQARHPAYRRGQNDGCQQVHGKSMEPRPGSYPARANIQAVEMHRDPRRSSAAGRGQGVRTPPEGAITVTGLSRRKTAAKVAEALEQQWQRKTEETVAVDLPAPLSTNDLWSLNRQSMFKSKAYSTWLKAALQEISAQRAGRVLGGYSLTILVNPACTRADLDNCAKAISDVLQLTGVIENDKMAERVVIEWSGEPTKCRAIVCAWAGRPMRPLRNRGGKHGEQPAGKGEGSET